MFFGQFYEKRLSEKNMKSLLETVTYTAIKVRVPFINRNSHVHNALQKYH